MKKEWEKILEDVEELGYVRWKNKRFQPDYRRPRFLSSVRNWETILDYLAQETTVLPDGDYFVTCYDGWREYTDYEPLVHERQHVNYLDLSETDQKKLLQRGYGGEVRFISPFPRRVYIQLPLPVLCFTRHRGDDNAILLPDHVFVRRECEDMIRRARRDSIPWRDKKSRVVWRGGDSRPLLHAHGNSFGGYSYLVDDYKKRCQDGEIVPYPIRDKMHCRELAMIVSHDPRVSSILNLGYDFQSIEDMLQNRYVLDLDGCASSWEGLRWKLGSGSVVWKLKSPWEQWYYHDLQPWIHYVPLPSLHPMDILATFAWCETHPEECQMILQHSSEFIDKLLLTTGG